MTQSTTQKLAYGITEAALLIGKSRSALYEAMGSGAITSYRDGRRRMISARALAEYVERKEREGRAAA
jgi:excisionase family DNA binding protein